MLSGLTAGSRVQVRLDKAGYEPATERRWPRAARRTLVLRAAATGWWARPSASVYLDDRQVDAASRRRRRRDAQLRVETDENVLVRDVDVAARRDRRSSVASNGAAMTRTVRGRSPADVADPGGAVARVRGVAVSLVWPCCVPWLAGDRQLRRFLSELDEQLLGQAGASLEQLLARQRDQLVAEVKVLADDNRIRATVLAPKFDEATVQDILEDLRKSSGATLLAVVDAAGKVTAVTGAAGLREVNLGASPAVKTGFDRPTSDVWTLPDQVQVVGRRADPLGRPDAGAAGQGAAAGARASSRPSARRWA